MSQVTSNRNSTFSGLGLYRTYDPSIIQAQQVQRLRVNRVALVQSLRVDHVIPKLCEAGVLSASETTLVLEGNTQQEKTRLLIDLLPAKGKNVDWYATFKDALKHPDTRNADVRQKYKVLIEFLDNTNIAIPPKKIVNRLAFSNYLKNKTSDDPSFPRYDPLPNISQNTSPAVYPAGFDTTTTNSTANHSRQDSTQQNKSEIRCDTNESTNENNQFPVMTKNVATATSASLLTCNNGNQYALIKGNFLRQVTMPENFKGLIKTPELHFKLLAESGSPDDLKMLDQEKEVLVKAQNVEVVYALDRRHKLPTGMALSFSHAVVEMLKDPNNYHLYFKYFQELANRYNLNIMMGLAASFTMFVSDLQESSDVDVRKQVVNVGFGLFDFVCNAGLFVKAEGIILELMRFLSTCPELDNWVAIWQALVKLQTVSNSNGYFKDADQWYVLATQMGDKIKMVSFGKDLLDESQLFIGLSITHREQGSLGPAYQWAQAAVKEVDSDNYSSIVEVLCHATLAYSMQWNVKQAEKLIIQAVRTAKAEFGENHPLYVKSLIHLVLYCNEFRRDEYCITIARKAVDIAEKIYGGAASLLTAEANELLAKTLIVNQHFNDGEYERHGQRAIRMAMDILPSLHPKFASYKMTNAQVLLWKASLVEGAERESALMQAEEEAMTAMQIYKLYWGEYSLKLAQCYTLLGQIYNKMDNKKDAAEEMLKTAGSIYILSVNPNSNYQSLMKATMGTFYKSVGKPLQAIDCLTDCIKNVSNCGVFLKWVHVAYECLIGCFRSTNQMGEAESLKLSHVDWMKKNPKPADPITWEVLHEAPLPFEEFRQKFFALATQLKKCKRGLNKFFG